MVLCFLGGKLLFLDFFVFYFWIWVHKNSEAVLAIGWNDLLGAFIVAL